MPTISDKYYESTITEFEIGGREWAPVRCEAPGNFFGRAPPLFGSKSTICRFGVHFCDGQYSLVSFLFAFLLLLVPPHVQPFVKVGGHVSPCPTEHGQC